MNILVLTKQGGLLGLADRFTREGHSVRILAPIKQTGRGIYQLIQAHELPSAVKWCKFIVSDWPQPESFYEKLSMYNKPIVGMNYYTDLVNQDCIKEHVVMERMGVHMPRSKMVTEISEIYRILMMWDLPRYDIRFDRTWYAGHHKEFMNWAVSRIPPGDVILLQEPVIGDVDVQIIGLFNGQDWTKPYFVSSWDNSLGSAVAFPLLDGNQLAVQNLDKLANYLRQVDYHGPVSARLTLIDEQVYFREIFFGFRTPEIYAILENIKAPASSIFHALAFTMDMGLQTSDKVSAAVEVSADNWKDMRGAPILNMEQPEKIRHIFPSAVMKSDVKMDEYFVSGEHPVIYTTAAYGPNVKEIRNRIARTIENSEFPQMRYNLVLLNQITRLMMVLKDRKYLDAA